MKPAINILCHLFYPGISEELVEKLSYFNNGKTPFFFNIQGNKESRLRLEGIIRESILNAYLLTTPNKGRDIAGKLTLMHLSILIDNSADYSLIIHDKKSVYTPDGEKWRNELLKIISPKYANKVFDIFKKNEDVGIVCSANYIQNEYDDVDRIFLTNNDQQIRKILKDYNIETNDYRFVAGNIFWIRTSLLKQFFKTRSIPRIKADLEDGNVMDVEKGTFIHAWERIMSWIATSNNQRIYGI